MAQTSITSFFNSRKRAATDDSLSSKSKVPHIDRNQEFGRIALKTHLVKSCQLVKDVKQPHLPAAEVKLVNVTKIEKGNLPVVAETDPKPEIQPEKPVFAKKVNSTNIAKTGEPSKSNATSSARKELSLGDIRKKLAGSSRLAEIKANAERLSKSIQQLKEASEKRNLKEFKSIDVEVPSRYANDLLCDITCL